MKLFNRLAISALVLPAALIAQTMTWQTTHPNRASTGFCQLQTNKITLTVNPFHIDVEEEAVISTRGTVWSGDSATLEINGEFTLTKGSAVRSMLLWNGTTILKAKLKDRKAADSAYEDVVDRTVMRPVVRDPALIEYMGNGQYRFKIYPVAINGSRKLRVLYSVPLQTSGTGPEFLIQSAFTMGATDVPTQIPVVIKRPSNSAAAYIITYGSISKTIQFGATYQIPYTSLVTTTMNYWGGISGTSFTPVRIVPDTLAAPIAYTAAIETGRSSGHYTALFATPPRTILTKQKELLLTQKGTLEAKFTAGNNIYVTDFKNNGYLGVYIKSNTCWDSTVSWTLYNEHGKIAAQVQQIYAPKSDSLTNNMLPLVWGAKYSLVEGLGDLGALYGFVDRQMSLLALESDTLPRLESTLYAQAGVPPLNAADIILNPSELPSTPDENIMVEFGTAVMRSIQNKLSALTVTVLANRTVSLRLGSSDIGSVKVVVLDLAGRVVSKWDNLQIKGGTAEIHLPASARGCLVMRVYAGMEMVQKKITLP